MNNDIRSRVGAVVIGRNEGLRLITCLKSMIRHIDSVVYVDSGSDDNSLNEAKELGVKTISLDLSTPFTAARARNEGARFLLEQNSKIDAIQFLDGDCEMQTEWLSIAFNFLNTHDDYAIVCGRRRERFPDDSIYNYLCDIEWNTPIGDAMACGGDALIRADAYQEVNGYRDDFIAGEEPEMCFRLREKSWRIYRIDVEMTLHDAAITKLSQWWKRAKRAGYAFALGSSVHGRSAERYWVKETQRIIVWGLVLPLLSVIFSIINPWFLVLWLIYSLQIIRVALSRPELGPKKYAWAASVVLGKLAEACGLLRFWFDKLGNNNVKIIEYK